MKLGKNLGIFTITWARSQIEAQRIIESLTILSQVNLPIIAIDNNSDKDFIQEVSNIGNINIFIASKKGLWEQIKIGLTIIQEKNLPFFLYTESDKKLFFQQISDFLNQAQQIINQNPSFGVILPARNTESFNTFPPIQKKTEDEINKIIGQIIGLETDYTYGPRIISSSLIPSLLSLPDDINWGWLTASVLLAKKLGRNIYAVPMSLPCPEKDRLEDEKELRLKQKQDHLLAISIYQQ